MSDKIRLLICKTCGSATELPWHDGSALDDVWLKSAVDNHPKFGDGRPHIAGGLFNIDVKQFWSTPQQRKITLQDLYNQLEIPGTGPGLGDDYYDLKSTYLEDAMTCWRVEHNRTTNCGDYLSEKKRLLPDTAKDRKSLGLDPKDRPNTFLCHFCPYNELVQQKKREKKGLYK